MTQQTAQRKAGPGTAAGPVTAPCAISSPAKRRRGTCTVVWHTPGRAVAQPPCPTRMRNKPGCLRLLFSARIKHYWKQPCHSTGYQIWGSDEVHQVSSQSFHQGNTLPHLSSLQLWKIWRYLPFSSRDQGHYRIQLKVLPIRMREWWVLAEIRG